ncbi:toprim domain-containing protein [Vibrio tubiashii]|uniref:toprim domain-containing protein n=1 Tax=Vibrio tubiashii TaxID=29498 RepID=UPI001EFC8522|nr:toprim domain-containing protein [Vibrio tubiashii]MCG9578601.1 toprim domain-containing protein [Vibrio tubiashii]
MTNMLLKVETHLVAITGNRVIITESPMTAARIQAAIGGDTMATYGHIFDFVYKDNKLGLQGKNPALIERLGFLNESGMNIVLATDSDSQGELIAQHVKALTPSATHIRVHINELTPHGINTALRSPFAISDAKANEAAYLRLLNLKMAKIEPRGTFTTTSITLAKSFALRGRLAELEDYNVECQGKTLYTRFAKKLNGEFIGVRRPPPANTRQIAQLAASQNNLSIHNELQELYQAGRLSYIRTESRTLPMSNEIYTHHVSDERLNEAHYAIHNLTPYSSDLEQLVFKINDTARTSSMNVLEIHTSIGNFIALDRPLAAKKLRPAAEIMMHLSLDSDSYVSTLGRSSEKYARVFFNGERYNERAAERVMRQGNLYTPDIVEHGVKHIVQAHNAIGLEHVQAQQQVIEQLQHSKNSDKAIAFPSTLDIAHSM